MGVGSHALLYVLGGLRRNEASNMHDVVQCELDIAFRKKHASVSRSERIRHDILKYESPPGQGGHLHEGSYAHVEIFEAALSKSAFSARPLRETANSIHLHFP